MTITNHPLEWTDYEQDMLNGHDRPASPDDIDQLAIEAKEAHDMWVIWRHTADDVWLDELSLKAGDALHRLLEAIAAK